METVVHYLICNHSKSFTPSNAAENDEESIFPSIENSILRLSSTCIFTLPNNQQTRVAYSTDRYLLTHTHTLAHTLFLSSLTLHTISLHLCYTMTSVIYSALSM